MNLHILLDIDGVLADFVGGVEKEFDVDLSDLEAWGMATAISAKKDINLTKNQFWNKIQSNDRFWADLEPYPWAFDLVDMLKREVGPKKITLVTSPDMAVKTYTQKAYWVGKHFPDLIRQFFIGPQKWLMAKENRILIDDSDFNIKNFEKHGGYGLTFPQKWNQKGFSFLSEATGANPVEWTKQKITNIVQ